MTASVPLEELHGALVALRGRECLEGAEIPPLARARVLLALVEAELARFELPDHAAKLLIGAIARHPSRAPSLRSDLEDQCAEIGGDEASPRRENAKHLGEPPALEVRSQVVEHEGRQYDIEVIAWRGDGLDRGHLEAGGAGRTRGLPRRQGDHLRRGIDAQYL